MNYPPRNFRKNNKKNLCSIQFLYPILNCFPYTKTRFPILGPIAMLLETYPFLFKKFLNLLLLLRIPIFLKDLHLSYSLKFFYFIRRLLKSKFLSDLSFFSTQKIQTLSIIILTLLNKYPKNKPPTSLNQTFLKDPKQYTPPCALSLEPRNSNLFENYEKYNNYLSCNYLCKRKCLLDTHSRGKTI